MKKALVVILLGLSSCSVSRIAGPPKNQSVNSDRFCLSSGAFCREDLTKHGVRPDCTELPEDLVENTVMYSLKEDGPACGKMAVAQPMGDAGIGLCTLVMCQKNCKGNWQLVMILCVVQYELSQDDQKQKNKYME